MTSPWLDKNGVNQEKTDGGKGPINDLIKKCQHDCLSAMERNFDNLAKVYPSPLNELGFILLVILGILEAVLTSKGAREDEEFRNEAVSLLQRTVSRALGR